MYLLAIFSIISGVFLLDCFLSYKTNWYIYIYNYIMLCNHNAILNIMYTANYDFICIIDTTYIYIDLLWSCCILNIPCQGHTYCVMTGSLCVDISCTVFVYTHIDLYILCMYVKLCHKCTHVFSHINQCYTCPHHSDVSPEDVYPNGC